MRQRKAYLNLLIQAEIRRVIERRAVRRDRRASAGNRSSIFRRGPPAPPQKPFLEALIARGRGRSESAENAPRLHVRTPWREWIDGAAAAREKAATPFQRRWLAHAARSLYGVIQRP